MNTFILNDNISLFFAEMNCDQQQKQRANTNDANVVENYIIDNDNDNNNVDPQFTSYDVLLMPFSQNDTDPLPLPLPQVRFAPGNHVGNERFQVLLNIYRERFILADMLNNDEERMNIAKEVLNTVTTNCSPKGRFFEQTSALQWREMELDLEVLNVIQSALKMPPIVTSNYISHVGKYAPVSQKKRENSCNSNNNINSNNNTADFNTDEQQYEFNKRTCRRSSVFSMLYTAAQTTQDLIVTPNPFDVLCEPDGHNIKLSGHIGNNRLKVMFDIRMNNYKLSDPSQKLKIAQEIVSSLMDESSGRFLQKVKSTGMYRPLHRDAAVKCVNNALSSSSGVHQQLRASAVQRLIDRKQKKALLDKIEHRKSLESVDSNEPPPTTFTAFKRTSVMSSVGAGGADMSSTGSSNNCKRVSTLSQDSGALVFKRSSTLTNISVPGGANKRSSTLSNVLVGTTAVANAPVASDSPKTPKMKQNKFTAHAA